jgi:DNA polymerase I-like protein with 3'-5' exonuclease and polymerase domains
MRQDKDAEVLIALLELKSIKTRSSLYWEAYPKFLHWMDNLLHPEVRQCSTNTRRHTSANPNIQQQDSTQGGVRSVMKPHRKDAVFVSLDLAGQEIRLLGDYSRDENILSAYIGDPPRDLHSFTAAMILGLSYEEFRARFESKDEAIASEANLARQRGKTVFFASSYGAMAPKIALGLGISEELAQTYLDALDKVFP